MVILAKNLIDGDSGFCAHDPRFCSAEEFKPKPTTKGSYQTNHDSGVIVPNFGNDGGGRNKRLNNSKQEKVLWLIKFTPKMELIFAKSTRWVALWEELAELLVAEGIKRDGKQCREKCNKMMAKFKDVSDGNIYYTNPPLSVEKSKQDGLGERFNIIAQSNV